MSRLTYAQKQAFGETVAQFIRDNHSELRKAGFDPSKKLAELEKSLKATVQMDVQQESLKAELVKTTRDAVAELHSTYRQASSLIDAMVGIFGNRTPMARRLRKLRDQMVVAALRGKRTVAS